MGNKEKIICRLCLQILDSNFEVIGNVTKDVFIVLLLKIDLSITERPVMCKNCAKEIQRFHNFKISFINAEERIHFFASSKGTTVVDLREICSNKEKQLDIGDVHICRFCIQHVRIGQYTPLSMLKEDLVLTEDTLTNYFPEIDLGSTEAPVVCSACLKTIEDYISFMASCSNIERKITEYVRLEGTNSEGKVTLKNVLQCVYKDMLKYSGGEGTNTNTIKIKEELQESEEFEGLDAKYDIIKSEEELMIKDEETKANEAEMDSQRSQEEMVVSKQGTESVLTYTCTSGEKKFNLKFHIQVKDSSNMMYKCEVCNYETKWTSHLKRHVFTHKRQLDICYKCQICRYKSLHKDHLKSHMLTHNYPSETLIFNCGKCRYKTNEHMNIKHHLRKHMGAPKVELLKCGQCTYEARYKSNLTAHTLKHKDFSEITTYKCEMCPYQAKFKYKLKIHTLTHKDPSEVTMYKCVLCPYQGKLKYGLKKHILRSHKDPSEVTTYKCTMCQYQRKSKRGLHVHMLTHKDPSELTMYQCTMCPYQGILKEKIKTHMLAHKGPLEMYKCEMCPYQGKLKSHLKTHMLTHMDPSERTMYKCTICTFETAWKGSLRKHVQIHGKTSLKFN